LSLICFVIVIIGITAAGYIYKATFKAQTAVLEKTSAETLPVAEEAVADIKIPITTYHDPVTKVSVAYPSTWQLIPTSEGFSLNSFVSKGNTADGGVSNTRLFFYVTNSVPNKMQPDDISIIIGGTHEGQYSNPYTACIKDSNGTMECDFTLMQFNKERPIITIGYGAMKQFSNPQSPNAQHNADQEELKKVYQENAQILADIDHSLTFDK
jgi:hypothetical protein